MEKTGLLAIHGFGGTPCEVSEIAEVARQRGWLARTPLLPGHGTTVSQLRTVRFTDWINLAERNFQNLSREVGRLGVIGLSMGGLLALHLAESLVNRMIPVCVISTPYHVVPSYLRPFVMLLGKLGVKVRPKGRDIEGTTGEVLDCPSLTSIPLTAINQLILLRDSVVGKLNAVKCPVLIIHSEKDALISSKDAKKLFHHVGSRCKKLIILKHGGHNLLRDYNRKQVISLVLKWMERQWDDGTEKID